MKEAELQNQEKEVKNENGTTTIITLLIMMLLMGFVTFALTRSANETIALSNEISETKTLFAAQASIENMVLKADAKFEDKLTLDSNDVTAIQGSIPSNYSDYTFIQSLTKTRASEVTDATGQQFQGLKVLRDEWQAMTTATENATGVKVTLRRRFFANRIPIFQFGIFYDDDLEFHPGPRFDFGGRVHSNGSLFMMAGTGLYFSSRVSAVGQVVTDIARNGRASTQWGENVYIKNGSGTYVKLKSTMGSVQTSPINGTNVFSSNTDMPTVYKSANWDTNRGLFQGNLLAEQKLLELPIKIASKTNGNPLDYIELIRRGKKVGDLYNNAGTLSPVTSATEDSVITSKERYANKRGIRISLSDSKAKLPGCASGTGITPVSVPCGRRLDGNASGSGDADVGEAKGYQPKAMTDGYQATRVNGERFSASGKKLWIKIELVDINSTNSAIETEDVTEDILSLGVTEAATPITVGGVTKFEITGYGDRDSRSIVKLQRFNIPGPPIISNDTNYLSSFSGWDGNVVISGKDTTDSATVLDDGFTDNDAHKYSALVDESGKDRKVSPFPIQMFDTREGLYNDDFNATHSSNYGNNVPWAGVMSMIDIDVANMKKFLDGDFNTLMPASGTLYSDAKSHALRNTDVPQANGWVLYVSDRRGDDDFDGEYDMEDIFGNNDGIKQPGEDINNNGTLEADYTNEAVRYTGTGNHVSPAYAATIEHSYYRRGVRLINGTTLPGTFDIDNSLNTKGFTVATENGVYVKGNYNATGVNSVGSPTASTEYLPQNSTDHIPASIVADAITILSNNWKDAKSFRYPFQLNQRKGTQTTIRFAMLAGDAKSSYEATPNQGGGDPRLSGGVHNFKRFLEDWDESLNYAGSLINLYNSRNNNGAFKCCNKVYSPPTRNWVFDASFLDPTRLPPGTPFLQSITLTGFERIND